MIANNRFLLTTALVAMLVAACGGAGVPTGFIQQPIGGGVVLTWTPNTIGGWNGQGDTDWNTADTYCRTTTINGQTGWRLPTQFELSSLYDSGLLAGKPGWTLNYTWSSTPDEPGVHPGSGIYHGVSLSSGIVGWFYDTEYVYVSCVR